MKALTFTSLCLITAALAACGSDEKTTTVYHERPVVVQPVVSGTTPGTVEMNCAHGYDNSTHSCY